MDKFAAVAASINAEAAARARGLAAALRAQPASHPHRADILEMAGHCDTTAESFATCEPLVMDGITITNTTPGEAGIALLMAAAVAEDNPATGIPAEIFRLVTEPVTRRPAHDALADKVPGNTLLQMRAVALFDAMDDATRRLHRTGTAKDHARTVAALLDLFQQYARLLRVYTPDGTAWYPAHGACDAPSRRELIDPRRPELGHCSVYETTPCGKEAALERFGRAAVHGYWIPVYACPDHAQR